MLSNNNPALCLCLLLLAYASPAAVADDPPVPVIPVPQPAVVAPTPPPIFYGDFSLGYVRTSGNSNTTSLNAAGDLVYKSTRWENTFNADAISARAQGATTDEKYDLLDKLLYNLDPVEYLFTEGDYDNDRFAGVAVRYALSAGYGRHFIKTATQTLDLDLGAGVNHTRDQGSDDYQTRLIGVAGGMYVWKISATSQFKQTLRTEFSTNNTFINPISQLKLNIVGQLFATLNYELRYNREAPNGSAHTDQIESVNIGYTFGNKPKSS